MIRAPRSFLRAAVAAALLLSFASAGPASATPPEGCVGLPDYPALFVCVTQWTPENAVPTVGQSPGQTYTIPEFCVFECFGPTPVTVPDVTVTEGSGVVAVIEYDGSTYPVTVPPLSTVSQTVDYAEQQVQSAIGTVLGIVGGFGTSDGVLEMEGTWTEDCSGCGSTQGTLAGTYVAAFGGQVYTGTVAGTFAADGPPAVCPLIESADGVLDFGALGSAYFVLERVGATTVVSLYGALSGSLAGTWAVTSPVGYPCGANDVTAAFTLTGPVSR